MAEATVYNIKGEKVGLEKLDDSIFGVQLRPDVVHEAVRAQMANSRQVLAHTKDRSEVRGGGKKPWRQKGTGRARHGSSRSPIWIGGGVTFGPTNERNFSIKVNKKVRRLALCMSLSDKANEKKIYILDDISSDGVKTKDIYALLKNIGLRKATEEKGKKATEKKGEKDEKKEAGTKEKFPRVLVVLPKEKRQAARYIKNISKVTCISAQSLNAVDVLKNTAMVLPKSGLSEIYKTYGEAK